MRPEFFTPAHCFYNHPIGSPRPRLVFPITFPIFTKMCSDIADCCRGHSDCVPSSLVLRSPPPPVDGRTPPSPLPPSLPLPSLSNAARPLSQAKAAFKDMKAVPGAKATPAPRRQTSNPPKGLGSSAVRVDSKYHIAAATPPFNRTHSRTRTPPWGPSAPPPPGMPRERNPGGGGDIRKNRCRSETGIQGWAHPEVP